MTFRKSDYAIAWISALHEERAAAEAMLDEQHDDLSIAPEDSNAYTFGRIGRHNIVIASLPAGTFGTTSAAIVAANLLRSFPNIRVGLLVGVGGGVPAYNTLDLRLGDIVVGYPELRHGGVIQYDFGSAIQERRFVMKGTLDKPPVVLRNAVTKMRAKADRKDYDFERHFNDMLQRNPRMTNRFKRPAKDDLYEAGFIHLSYGTDCGDCSLERIVVRRQRSELGPRVFYGTIGSANQVLRDALLRDKLHEESGILCFEMEAAGLMDNFPCIVIRGISDYADTHKNKDWQPYAGAMAAAFAKELLLTITPVLVTETPQKDKDLEAVANVMIANQAKDEQCLRDLRQTDPRSDKMRIRGTRIGAWEEASQWIETNDRFQSWRSEPDSQLLCIAGKAGGGKTMLLCSMIDALESDDFQGTATAYFFLPVNIDRPSTGVAVLRGLMFMMIRKHSSLVQYVRKEYDHAGRDLFEDTNSWYALSEIFSRMLQDPLARGSTFLVHAIDKCTKNKDDLLRLIVRIAYTTPTKWIISSDDWPGLEKQLLYLPEGTRLSIELSEGALRLPLWYTSATVPDSPRHKRRKI